MGRGDGGGFGGCIGGAGAAESGEGLLEHVAKAYRDKFGKSRSTFVTTATAGAKIVE